MTDVDHLRQLVENLQRSRGEITRATQRIHADVIDASAYIDAPNFTSFHPDDLYHLFDEYDRLFFDGLCRRVIGDTELRFRISKRMTRTGGTTARLGRRGDPASTRYEITVASTLLFQTFHDIERPILVTGIECRDRLQAMQRIFEHEMIHLVELLLWERSSCKARRFQSIAGRMFGHTDHRHQLVTSRERAATRFGLHPGSRVRFRLDGAEYVGIVNRITKRATILVEDETGPQYSDGKRYAKFYIPLGMLEPVA